MREKIYSVETPEMLLLDIDSTLFATFVEQEGEGFNFHYSSHGYHPLLFYDGLTGGLLKSELRNGTIYTLNGVVEFTSPILKECMDRYPGTALYLRGDSGFSVPELFDLPEHNGGSSSRNLCTSCNCSFCALG